MSQDGVGMHTHETHCSTQGALAVVLASHFIMSWCTVPRVSCKKVSYDQNYLSIYSTLFDEIVGFIYKITSVMVKGPNKNYRTEKPTMY